MAGIDRKEWIENPKLLYHPDWLEKWRKDPFSVPPIYVEVSPAGKCNHRCTFCAPELLGYPDNFLDPDVLKQCFQEMRQIREETGNIGFKSIQFAGEGEPGLHRDLAQIIRFAREAGMDVGVLSNGTFLIYENSLEIVPLINGYLQVSVNAGKPETYAKIHRAPIRHWDIVWRHIEGMVKVKRTLGTSGCDIGINMTLLTKESLEEDGRVIPSNWQEAELLVRRARDCGVDYVTLKPYSQDAYGIKTARLYGDMRYDPQMEEIRVLSQYLINAYSSPSFEVIFRISRFEEYEKDRGYNTCLAVPVVWSYIQSDGSWLSCSAHWTNREFILGNIYSQAVREIWFGDSRREHMRFVLEELDVSRCRKGCHVDKENRYLRRLSLMSDEEFRREMTQLRTLPRPKNANFI